MPGGVFERVPPAWSVVESVRFPFVARAGGDRQVLSPPFFTLRVLQAASGHAPCSAQAACHMNAFEVACSYHSTLIYRADAFPGTAAAHQRPHRLEPAEPTAVTQARGGTRHRCGLADFCDLAARPEIRDARRARRACSKE